MKIIFLNASFLFLVYFANTAIIIQAPKYLPKNILRRMIRKYVKEARDVRALTNKRVEYEIPVELSLKQRSYRSNPKANARKRSLPSISEQNNGQLPNDNIVSQMQAKLLNKQQNYYHQRPNDPTLYPRNFNQAQFTQSNTQKTSNDARNQYENENYVPAILRQHEQQSKAHEHLNQVQNRVHQPSHQGRAQVLAQARKMVLDEEQRLQAMNTDIISGIPRRRGEVLKQGDVVYKEDLDQALAELTERLKDGNRPVYKADLRKAMDDFEKRYREHPLHFATTTINPCGKESILREGMKPVLKQDLQNYFDESEIKNTGHKIRRSFVGNDVDAQNNGVSASGDTMGGIRKREAGIFIDLNQLEFRSDIMDLLHKGAVVGKSPVHLQEQGLIPVRFEIPKSYKDLVIKSL